MTTKRH